MQVRPSHTGHVEHVPVLHPGASCSVQAHHTIRPFDGALAGMVAAGLGAEAITLYLGLSRDGLDDSLARLGLPTPHGRPLRRSGGRGWSAKDVQSLVVWRLDAIHPASIAERLSRPGLVRSADAVRTKARRMGLPAPARKHLRRADPAALPEPAPLANASFPGTAPEARIRLVSTVGGAAVLPRMARGASGNQAGRQGSLRLFRSVPARAPSQASTSLVPASAIVAPPKPAVAVPAPQAPATRDASDISWIAGMSRIDRDEEAVRAISLRYFGGQHYKHIARDAGMTEASIRSIFTRVELPRDHDRSKFGRTWDPERARATLERSGYVLQRDVSFTERPEHLRPLFWRKKRDAVRTSRATRFQNGQLGEWDKYQGQTVVLVTRADLATSPLPFPAPDQVRGSLPGGPSSTSLCRAFAPFAKAQATVRR